MLNTNLKKEFKNKKIIEKLKSDLKFEVAGR